MTAKTALTVTRASADENAFREIFGLLIDLHKEGGYAPLVVDDLTVDLFHVLEEGMTFVARNDGVAIGLLALTQERFSYNRSVSVLHGKWFYVKPAYRRGRVGRELMITARKEAEARKLMCFITVTNPDRRPKRTRIGLQAQIVGFVPLGYTIKIN